MIFDPTSRRQFNQLLLAAFSGAVAGATLGCSCGPPGEEAEKEKGSNDADSKTASEEDSATTKKLAATHDEKLLLVGDPHICRGLNQCKNQGKSKMNACAGQGACATAESHSCDALNVCKGQGGCDGFPGQNQCKGQGACAVPLTAKTWRKARAQFEQVMAKKHKQFGSAPAKS